MLSQRFYREAEIWSGLWARDQEEWNQHGTPRRILPFLGFCEDGPGYQSGRFSSHFVKCLNFMAGISSVHGKGMELQGNTCFSIRMPIALN